MRAVKLLAAVVATTLFLAPSQAQPPQPGPEMAHCKNLVGTWDATMKMQGMEAKGVMTYKMDLGGLWLGSVFEAEMAPGQKFFGRGFETYDAGKKKYVAVWLDSMSTVPMVMEGTFDEKTKTMTMIGDAPDMNGKLAKHRLTTTRKDENTMEFAMYLGDAKEPMMTITYKRRK